jgi:hypothetical protein
MSTEAERRFRGMLFLTRDDSSRIQAIKLVVDGWNHWRANGRTADTRIAPPTEGL